jgi:uncharacterized membrane protein YkoI
MRSLILLTVLALGAAISVEKGETKIPLKDLPEAVRKTVAEQSRNATLVGISKEVEGDKTFYEVELKVNGKGRDVLIDAAGAVVELEEEIDMASVPAAARSALTKLSTGGKITKVEVLTKGGKTTYEAAIEKNGKSTEVTVTAEGSRVKDE